jgi:hypothetical protein
LNVRQTTLETANDIGIRRDPEPNAVNDRKKAPIGLGHDIDISLHTRFDSFELPFTKVGNRPPPPRVNQEENLLPDMGVSAFGYR